MPTKAATGPEVVGQTSLKIQTARSFKTNKPVFGQRFKTPKTLNGASGKYGSFGGDEQT